MQPPDFKSSFSINYQTAHKHIFWSSDLVYKWNFLLLESISFRCKKEFKCKIGVYSVNQIGMKLVLKTISRIYSKMFDFEIRRWQTVRMQDLRYQLFCRLSKLEKSILILKWESAMPLKNFFHVYLFSQAQNIWKWIFCILQRNLYHFYDIKQKTII